MHCDHNRSPIKSQLRLIVRILFTSTCLAKDNICVKPPPCSKGRSKSGQTSWSAPSSDEVQWSVESPFPVHVLPKKYKIYIYLKTHYITVTLATLADYIIRHQWESWKRHTETPAEVIGCNSAWCWERSLRGSSKSLHLLTLYSHQKTNKQTKKNGVPSVRTRDKTKAREAPTISRATVTKPARRSNVFPFFVGVPVFPLHGHVDSKSIYCSVGFPALLRKKE